MIHIVSLNFLTLPSFHLLASEVMSDHPADSVAVSLPPQTGYNGDGQRSAIENAWSAITSPFREIWSPLAYQFGESLDDIRTRRNQRRPGDMKTLITFFISHLIACLIMTILLPISLLWKLIIKGRFTQWLLETSKWSKWLLAVSCIAITLDPLFFYIPFIDEKNKCLGMDTKLRAAALALRSLTDLAFALHIVAEIDAISDQISRVDHFFSVGIRMKWLSDSVIDFIGILPIPQVTIIIAFFNMRGSGYLYKSTIGNVFLLLQFIARGYQIYHFKRQFRMLGEWTTSAFYFFMYISAGNILGAFWYFLSIQREISCWYQTCKNITGCVAINYCEDTSSSANITLLNEFCPISQSNATLYDFGVFLGALQSGNTGPINFWTKYFYTFWWGIRNLSNFGTNLETSNYVWENCFTILIALVGLLLFIYLMGNVQTYILWESTRALEDLKEKVNAKYQALDTWLSRNGIDEDMMKFLLVNHIKEKKVMERNCGDGRDVVVDLVFVFNAIKENEFVSLYLLVYFCLNALKKVNILQHMPFDSRDDEAVALLRALDPVSYKKDSSVVQEGKPDDKMLIITEGVITCTYKTSSDAATASIIRKSRFEKGEVYGQELLSMDVNQPTPMSTRDVICETNVEAFVLTADKLKGIVDFLERANKEALQYKSHDPEKANKAYKELTTTKSEKLMQQKMKMDCKERDIMEWLSRNGIPDDRQTSVMKHIKANHHVLEKNIDAEVDVKYLFSIHLPWDIEYDIKKHLCMSTLYKVPILNLVDEDVLHRICMSLEPVILPKNSEIFKLGDEIDRMLIIIEGEIKSTEQIYRGHGPAERGNVERVNKGDFFGEESLISAFPDTSISNSRPVISNKYVECCTKVEAFALTNEGVESVVAYYREGINKFEHLENGRDHGVEANTKDTFSSATTIEQRLDQLIQLQSDMLQQHRDEMANQGQRLDDMVAFLARLGYPGTPPPPHAA